MSSASLGSLIVSLEANIASFERDMGKALYQLEQFGARMDTVAGLAKAAIGGIVTAETIAKFSEFIQHGAELQEQMYKLAQRTGASVESMAGMKFAAEQADISLEQVASSAKKLANNMALHPALFAEFGVSAKDSTGALVQFANIIAGMPDGVNKIALANKVLGKSGEEMIPFLNQGGAAIQALIEKGKLLNPITDASAKAASDFNDKLRELKAQSDTLAINLSTALIPNLTSTLTEMNKLSESGHGLLAVLRGIAGIGKIPWDWILPPDNLKDQLSSKGMLADLNTQLETLKRQRDEAAGGGMLSKFLFGTTDELDKKILIITNQIETIKKHAAELDKPPVMEITVKTGSNKGDSMLKKLLGGGENDQAVVDALIAEYQKVADKFNRTINAPMMSAVDKNFADMLATVGEQAHKAKVEIEKFYASKAKDGIETEQQTANKLKDLAAVDAAQQKQIATLTVLEGKLKENNASWEYGAKVALRTYLDEVENVAKSMQNLFTSAFKGMEDALLNFVNSGKLDFSSLATSIINDMLRIQIQQQITGPLARLLGSALSGGGGAGGAGYGDTAGVAAGVPRYAGGGSTGSGSRAGGLDGMGGFLAMLHPQESVTDHTTPSGNGAGAVSISNNNTIHIDSRTDQAQIQQLVGTAVDQGNARLVDRLQRMRVI